eukprot:1160914-Pelagomonas_calceolata.AAC.26
MIIDKRLSVDRVANRIQEEYEEFLNVMFSDENAEQLVLRIRCVLPVVMPRVGANYLSYCSIPLFELEVLVMVAELRSCGQG